MIFEQTFPLVYCLNMTRNHLQRARCEEHFAKHLLKVRRFPAIDPANLRKIPRVTNPQVYAHVLSLQLIIRRAKHLKAPAVFIFEDDVFLSHNWRDRLVEIELPNDWEIFYLGCQHGKRPTAVGIGVVHVENVVTTHAWGIKANFYQKVLNLLSSRKRSCALSDQRGKNLFSSISSPVASYAAFPNLAWQAFSLSTAENTQCNDHCEDRYQISSPAIVSGLLAECLGGTAWHLATSHLSRKGLAENFHTSRESELSSSACDSARMEQSTVAPLGAIDPQLTHAPKLNRSNRQTAFLFLTKNGPNHPELWSEYWRAGGGRVDKYVHCSDASLLPSNWARDCLISTQPTAWGDISLVRAQCALLLAALDNAKNEFFVFCSESCVPIRPYRDWNRMLRIDSRSRFSWQTPSSVAQTDVAKANRFAAAPWIPASYWVFHSQWMMLNREAAELIVSEDFTSFFNKVFAPDESYFGTVLRLKGYPLEVEVAPFDVTWTDWSRGGPHPRTFQDPSPEEVSNFSLSQWYFARKFSRSSSIRELNLHVH